MNAICPGAIDTPRIRGYGVAHGRDVDEYLRKMTRGAALRRVGTPDEIAHVALFLASDDSSFVTGVSIPVDGGTFVYR